ncbi:ATP-binding cassette domain-containing protein [Staphylococcus aureus]
MALVVKDISQKFRRRLLLETKVLKGINFEVEQGEFVILNGASGSGKTTLLTILGGLLVKTVVQCFTMMRHYLINSIVLVIYDWKILGLLFFTIFTFSSLFKSDEQLTLVGQEAGITKQQSSTRAIRLLENIGLEDRLNVYPHQLSGGEKRRVVSESIYE